MKTRQSRRVLDVSVVAVAAAVLAVVAYWAIARYAGHGAVHVEAGERNVAASGDVGASMQYDVDRMVDAHLMGRPQDDEKPVDIEQAPETKLQLRLLGMIASANDQYARALIGVNSRDVGAYRVGESVEGTDARIHSVESSRVLLDRNGAVESLYLKTPDLFSDTPSVRSTGRADSRDVPDRVDDSVDPGTRQLTDSAGQAVPDEEMNEIPYTGIRETAGKRSNLPF